MKEESENVGLNLNIQKTKIIASGFITSWEIDRETVAYFSFGGSKITADGDWTRGDAGADDCPARLRVMRPVFSSIPQVLPEF